MQTMFWISQILNPSSPARYRWAISTTFLFVVCLLWPAQLSAQSTPPTPAPLAPANTLVVVARGHGSVLWSPDSSEAVAQIAPGARLVASKQSTDGQWLYVTTGDNVTGWAPAADLIIFRRLDLPSEDVVITAASPTPQPVATPASTVTESTTTDTAIATADAAPLTAAPGMTGDVPTGSVRSTTRLNVRSGPGLTHAVIGKAEPGQQLIILARNADQSWLEVQLSDTPNTVGWVAAQYIESSAALNTLAISARADAAPSQPIVATSVPAAAATSAPAAPAQTTAATGLTGKLVFQTSFGGPIYLYELASGALRQLTTGFDPALSPNGQQVAFTRGGGDNGVYLINVDGSNEHKIFGDRELLRSPKWSPDGKWIVFSRGDEFEPCFVYEDNGRCYREPLFPGGNAFDNPESKNHIEKLARVDVNGGNYRDIATMEQAVAPDWNSNGIVYQSNTGLQITADEANATNRELYFEIQRQYHQDPDWQPGGGRVVFQQKQGSHWQLFGINPDGNGLAALTRPVTALVYTMPSSVAPAWSPNGQSIVFLSNRTDANDAGPWRLWVMNADGSNQHPLPVNIPIDYSYVNEQVVDWGQ